MKKIQRKIMFETLEGKLNWCPNCGHKAEAFQCDGCHSVCIACHCSCMCAGNVNNVLNNSDAIAHKWNNRGLSAKWNHKVLEQLGLLNKEWLVVSETGEIVTLGSLEACFASACEFPDYDEYKGRSFSFYTLENDVPRLMTLDEVFDKLDFNKLDCEDNEDC